MALFVTRLHAFDAKHDAARTLYPAEK